MKTLPFFQSAPPAPKPERYPFHDHEDCPLGQEVKRRGQWQYYEPRATAETRSRCACCITLNRPGRYGFGLG